RLISAVAHKYASPSGILASKYDFLPAAASDKGEIMDATLTTFFAVEPHIRALGITREKGRDLVDAIVSKSLKYPHSMMVVHRDSGKLIGVRLMSEWQRDSKEEVLHIELDEGSTILLSILDNLKSEFWNIRADAKKVLRREIT
ncbi:hypothetical protein PMAYCL1PPCAC_17089, partial [Pristionchus mayeri]